MHKLLSVILWLTFASSALALNLQWKPNDAAEQITLYTIYRGTALTGPFAIVGQVNPASCSANSCNLPITGLTAGTYYFQVTATNSWAESGPSNVVSTPGGAPSAPKGLIIIATVAPDGTVTFRLMIDGVVVADQTSFRAS